MTAPDPVLQRHGRLVVVREDLLPGGSKVRFLPALVGDAREVVFGSPACGGAQLALAVLGRQTGVRITIFCAKRNSLHKRQLLAESNGARVVQVPFGYMTNVQKKARDYAAAAGALFLPLGFDRPEAEAPFTAVMRAVRARLAADPPEVWCATGSGMLARCLGLAFPASRVRAVAVGLKSRHGRQAYPPNVTVTEAGVPFQREVRCGAPFPCCPNYEAKAWRLASLQAPEGSLFWNVLGD